MNHLFSDLTNLTQIVDSPFYSVDQYFNGHHFRIFSYRLASYTDFQHPSALECRGHTFLRDPISDTWTLVSLPMEKFFNLMENPFTMNLDLSGHAVVMDKLDGSLISTVKVGDSFILKSKTSLHSTQVEMANNILFSESYDSFRSILASCIAKNYTVNMELLHPLNQIVISYNEPALRVLNIRSNDTGEYISPVIVGFAMEDIVEQYFFGADVDLESYLLSIKDMKGMEGVVVKKLYGNNHLHFKVKTEQYSSLHGLVSNLNSNRRLYELIVMEGMDDAMPLIQNNPVLLSLVESETVRIRGIMNSVEKEAREFYETNKHLIRKDYAILGQEKLVRNVFNLAIGLYIGKDLDMKEFMMKRYDDYGRKDETISDQ